MRSQVWGSKKPVASSQKLIFKERENDLSQLNRLGLTNRQDSNFVGAQPLVIVVFALPRFWQLRNHVSRAVQVRTDD